MTGQKRADDAAYSLASQLLAAELNLVAGATTCAELTQAVADAQALLQDLNFTGTGAYLPLKAKGSLAELRREALRLAAILDAYNNNRLCP